MKTDAIKFDPDRLTARQMGEMIKADATGNTDAMAKCYALACVALPKDWGAADDPATFAGMSQAQMNQVLKAWMSAGQAAQKNALEAAEVPDGVSYDLHKMKWADVMQLKRRVARNDINGTAEMLTRILTATPWGDASKADTYLDLSFYGAFFRTVQAVLVDVQDTEKKENSK